MSTTVYIRHVYIHVNSFVTPCMCVSTSAGILPEEHFKLWCVNILLYVQLLAIKPITVCEIVTPQKYLPYCYI